MITPVNHTQPQFRAKMYSCDISVLYNEAKRSNEAKKAISELAGMLRTLEKIHGQKASLELCTGGNQGKQYKILLDDKPVSSSTKSFIETLKNRSIKDFNINLTSEDEILTLSTCDDNNNYRVVLNELKIKK